MKDLSDCVVLVVDDTEANVDMLVEALGDDYDVMVAMDGEETLEMVEEERPDLILLDIMMPVMDGFEVCERLKADEATRDIPVIFLTGKADPEDKEKGMALGAIDYIIKPFDIPDVQARVKTHLEKIAGQA
ncbi:MAG: response regulator [Desulfobacterales bacterium]|nr:response regulator [Desulfobacterales bacterium]